ncbi:Eisosome assembly protein [Recurvomyces mirabilis]|nr:Eisosome assembly protein [Recurvomyces mirabilis]
MANTTRAGEMPCPDPSAHGHSHKLSEQASTAALYATDPARHTNPREGVLGQDGKLSSKSAAASLKYARAQDLPSFPSRGLEANSAGKAALLAKDYKMDELWQPELSSAGSRAALLAHNKGADLNLWQPTASSDGNSAAVLAMRKKGLSPELDRGYTADGKKGALMAASLSVHRNTEQKPAVEMKNSYPDANNASFNALNAATRSHGTGTLKDRAAPDGWNSDAMQAARVKNLGANMDPAMFTERPPVEIEQEELRHKNALQASAVSMAKQMYELQNRTALRADLTGADSASEAAAARQPASSQKDVKQEALRYINLQDAAHKLAQERLAKVDKNFEEAKYREYYGYPDEKQQTSPKKLAGNRLSMRSRGRRRAGSDAELDDSDDEEQARKIRSQMTQLNTGLSGVDDKKRNEDRARLMAAAEKNVHGRMHDMDEKVFADTGKVPPAMMEEWETKARKRAQENREMQAQHPGKTHIGGGKFIDQSEIEAIAAARLKPTLDEITATAEKKRARDKEMQEMKEEHEASKREEKQKQREEKDEKTRLKNEEKVVKQQEKDRIKRIEAEEKARKAEEQRKSREIRREPGEVAGGSVVGTDGEEEPVETSRQEKRQSTLGRLTSKLKRNKNKDEGAVDEEKAVEPKHETATNTAAVAGTAGLAAGGVAVADEAKPTHRDAAEEYSDPNVAIVNESRDDAVPTIVEPPTIVAPVAERRAPPPTMLQHMGSYNEPLSTAPSGDHADLERHISHIVDSDPESGLDDDDDDDEDEPQDELDVISKHMDRLGSAGLAKNHNELAEKGKQKVAVDSEALAAGAGAGAGAAALTGVAMRDHGAEKVPAGTIDQSQPVTQTTGSVPASQGEHPLVAAGPHTTLMGNVLDPNISSPADTAAGETTGLASTSTADPASKTIGPHESNVANVVDPRVQPEPSKQVSQNLGDETGPAPNTAGPHQSDVANIVDPRVKAEPEQLKAREKQAEGKSAVSNEATQKEQRGVRGFFSKFKKDRKEPGRISTMSGSGTGGREAKPSIDTFGSGSSSGEVRPTKPELVDAIQRYSHEDQGRNELAVGTSGMQNAGHIGTDGKIPGFDGKARAVEPALAEPVSPVSASSFRRHDNESRDLDDVSSSGLEEEDLDRGRGGRGSKTGSGGGLLGKLGLGKNKEKESIAPIAGASTAEAARTNSAGETDDDQFEEARDHFDETLAPPPAFGGQMKSSSPVRSTRFHEEV